MGMVWCCKGGRGGDVGGRGVDVGGRDEGRDDGRGGDSVGLEHAIRSRRPNRKGTKNLVPMPCRFSSDTLTSPSGFTISADEKYENIVFRLGLWIGRNRRKSLPRRVSRVCIVTLMHVPPFLEGDLSIVVGVNAVEEACQLCFL